MDAQREPALVIFINGAEKAPNRDQAGRREKMEVWTAPPGTAPGLGVLWLPGLHPPWGLGCRWGQSTGPR